MKVFWSWQSDTPGKIGRHFIRDTLQSAIERLKQGGELSESERDALQLDHDRQGVPGSPDLARTIFEKIACSAVFVADVTIVGVATSNIEGSRRKFINSNVAIEYGFAMKALGDAAILMVQNTHYGNRDDLPFDLQTKAGPIQFSLEPGATGTAIAEEKRRIAKILTEAIKLCIKERQPSSRDVTPFKETPHSFNIASFWSQREAIFEREHPGFTFIGGEREPDDRHVFRFDQPRSFYLRLIPTIELKQKLSLSTMYSVASRRELDVISKLSNRGLPAKNRFGAVSYDEGSNLNLVAFSQIFRNGEIWGVTRELVVPYQGGSVVPIIMVQTLYERVLANFIHVAKDELNVPSPFEAELGAFGLNGVKIALPSQTNQWANQTSDQIYENESRIRRTIEGNSPAEVKRIVRDFVSYLLDLAGVAESETSD